MQSAPFFSLSVSAPPLLILSGFLGAGKTTALRRLLPLLSAKGYRPAVILNDVQTAQLDASTLQELTDLVKPVDGACVCCDDPQSLIDALEALPLDSKLVVLLEANGATDVYQLMELLSSVQSLRRFAPPRLVGVVDGRRFQKRHWHNVLEAAQLRPASLLWLNRTEEMNAQEVVELENSLRQINSRARFLPPEEWVSFLETPVPAIAKPAGSASISTAAHSLAHGFSALSLDIPKNITRSDMENWLQKLPAHVLRVKGVLSDAEGDWLFQRTDAGVTGWEKLKHTLSVQQLVVLIGPGIEAQILDPLA